RAAQCPVGAVSFVLRQFQFGGGEAGGQFVHTTTELGKVRHSLTGRHLRHTVRHLLLTLTAALRVLALLVLARGLLRGFLGRTTATTEAESTGHLLHHLPRLEEAIDEVVDLTDGDSGPGRDALPAGRVDNLRVLTFRT